MTDKTIKELIEEAREQGKDIHSHVAQELWGTVNVTTRKLAKDVTFSVLYGGNFQNLGFGKSKHLKEAETVPNDKCPWAMTDEQLKSRLQTTSAEFYTEYDNCPMMDIPKPVSEDRIHRMGVQRFEVEVYDDAGNGGTIYVVHACDALDARCMAFVLDGGCEAGLKEWDDGHIELAISYTRIVRRGR